MTYLIAGSSSLRLSSVSSPFQLGVGRNTEISVSCTELVLLVLLQSFKFETTGKPIVWNNAPVLYPTIGKTSETPALPLKVSLLH